MSSRALSCPIRSITCKLQMPVKSLISNHKIKILSGMSHKSIATELRMIFADLSVVGCLLSRGSG